ncbi:hypothetical protein [Rathayibacter sp. AY1H3]|uniref:hypothetical protein n=1 Tax=Rathayibacter sp. AY1H3 TaxID=2080567 RepID=UPI002157BDDA|nr:hypothetical protein [Rathayibacter sp. AY1H3]
MQNFQTITADTLALVTSGDQAGAKARATDLETAWDDAEPALSAANCQTWTYVDQQIDPVLSSVRAGSPDPVVEKTSIQDLLTTLAGR